MSSRLKPDGALLKRLAAVERRTTDPPKPPPPPCPPELRPTYHFAKSFDYKALHHVAKGSARSRIKAEWDAYEADYKAQRAAWQATQPPRPPRQQWETDSKAILAERLAAMGENVFAYGGKLPQPAERERRRKASLDFELRRRAAEIQADELDKRIAKAKGSAKARLELKLQALEALIAKNAQEREAWKAEIEAKARAKPVVNLVKAPPPLPEPPKPPVEKPLQPLPRPDTNRPIYEPRPDFYFN